MSPFRAFLLWIINRTDIRISTVYIEYFKPGQEDNPIVLKFGHRKSLEE